MAVAPSHRLTACLSQRAGPRPRKGASPACLPGAATLVFPSWDSHGTAGSSWVLGVCRRWPGISRHLCGLSWSLRFGLVSLHYHVTRFWWLHF